MKFENGQFEKGISTSIRSMEELKKGMDFDDAVKGFNKLDEAAKGLKLTGLANGVEAVRVKFDLLQITAFNVLNRISNKAIDTGERMVKGLSIDQVAVGWSKFADKTGSVQTIMSATAKQFNDTGKQMEYVNGQLDKLNWFTDETSYNFVDMVNNIGKFTSNNIALEDAVTAMQGIANWAAISGANANEASRAMYNISQALSSGAVRLEDWMSIENANMGTAAFKELAIQMGVTAGTLKKQGDKIVTINKGVEVSVENFRNTLTEDRWLNKDVLMKTLNQYGQATDKLNKHIQALWDSGSDLLTSDLVTGLDAYLTGAKSAQEISDEWGMSLEETTAILEDFNNETDKFGLKAFQAAQEAKTFEDAINSVKDAVSTGWMKSMEYIFGDYLEAKDLWTDVANELYDLFAESGNARNEMLKDWKALGGRNYLVDAINGIILSLTSMKNTFHLAFADAFGVMDGQKLFDLTKAVHSFIVALIPGAETMNKFGRIIRGVASAIDILKTVMFGGIIKGFKLFQVLTDGLNLDVLEMIARIGDAIYSFRNWVHESTILNDAADRLIANIVLIKNNFRAMVDQFNAIPIVKQVRSAFLSFGKTLVTDTGAEIQELRINFGRFLDYLKNVKIEFSPQGFLTIWNKFVEIVIGDTTTLKKIGADVGNLFTKVFNILGKNLGFLEKPFNAFIQIIGHLLDELHVMISGIKAVDIAIVAFATSIFVSLAGITKAVKSVVGLFTSFTDIFGAFGETAKKWGTAKIIKSVGVALLAFAVALRLIADVPADRIWETVAVVGALGTMMVAFTAAIMGLDVAFKKFKISRKTILSIAAVGLSILAISYALKNVSAAMEANGGDLSAPIIALASVIATLSAALVLVGKLAPSITGSAAAIAGVGIAIALMITSIKMIAELDDPALSRGVAALSAIMIPLGLTIGAMALLGGKQRGVDKAMSTLIGFGIAVRLVVGAVKTLSKIAPEQAIVAVIELGVLMTEMGIAVGLMQRLGGGAIKAGGTLLALSVALNLLTPAIKGLASIDDTQLSKAKNVITQLGLIFVAAIGASALGGKESHKAGLMLIEMAAAITLLVVAVRAFGAMDTEVLTKGVTAVSVLGLVFSTAIAASRDTDKAKVSILGMTAAIGILAYSVYELSKIDTKALISSAGAISAVLLSFGGSMRLLKGLDVNAKTIVTIGLMAAIADVMSYLLIRMTQDMRDAPSAIGAATAIGLVLVALAGSINILSRSKGSIDAKLVKQLAMVGGIVAAIGGVIFALTAIPGTDVMKALGVMGGIAALLPVLSGSYYLLTKIKMAPSKTTIDKFVIFSEVIGALAAAIFVLTAIPGTDARKAVTVLVGIDALLPVMTACYYGLSKIRQSPPKSVIYSFTAFSAIVLAIGTSLAYISKIKTSSINNAIVIAGAIDMLIPVITACFAGMSMLKGNVKMSQLGMFTLFGALAEALGLGLAGIASIPGINLDGAVQMATIIQTILPILARTFSILAVVSKMNVNPAQILLLAGVLDAIGVLVSALVYVVGLFPSETLQKAVTNGTLIGEAIGGFIGGILGGTVTGVGKALMDLIPYFGEQLSNFADKAGGFFSTMSNLDDNLPGKVALMAGAIMALTGADFVFAVETLAGGLINKLSEALGINTDFSGKMKELGKGLSGFAKSLKGVDADKIKTAAEAAKILTAVEQSVPPKGGALQQFFGEQDIGEFGERLKDFGEALADFADKTKDITADKVKGAAEAGNMLAKLEQSVPAQDGKLQTFIGKKSLKDFGSRLSEFGDALVTFASKTSGITAASVQGAVNAGTLLSNLENGLPTTDGKFSKWFFGQKSFADFGTRLGIFGPALAKFAEDVDGITQDSVQGAADAVKVLSDIEQNLGVSGGIAEFWMGDNNFGQFANNLADLGEALDEFDRDVDNIDFDNMNGIITILQEVVAFADSLENVEDVSDSVRKYAKAVLDAFTGVFTSNQSSVKIAAQNIIKWVALGFDSGYRIYQKDLEDVGTKIGDRVDTAVRRRLEIASPSAVMAENGKWIVRGIAEGITKDMSAEEAAEKKASNIAAAFKTTFNNSDIFRQGIDLDYQLWEATEGQNADTATINARKYQKAVDELKLYADDAAVYKAQLEASLKAFGEGSIEYIKAENTYKQALLTMYQKKNEADQLVTTTVNDRASSMQSYAQIMAENAEAFKMLGKSDEELSAFAAEKSGNMAAHPVVQQIMDENREAFNLLGKSYDELEQFALNKSGLAAQNAGQQITNTAEVIAHALAGQEVEIQAGVAGAVKRGVSNGLNQGITEADPSGKGEGAGEAVNQGTAAGIEKSVEVVTTAIDKATGSNINELYTQWKSHSPSQVTYELGTWIQQGLANGITNNTYVPQNEAISSAHSVMDGFKQGLLDKEPEVMAEANRIAAQIAATLRAALKINSPSKVTMAIGNSVDEGLALGMRQDIGDVENASYDVTNAMAAALDDAKGKINDIVQSDEDFNPVITPVLNLDEINKQGSQIASSIGGRRTLDLSAARVKVGDIADQTVYGQNGSKSPTSQTNYNFTQNNYSPKALNRSEIYRHTNNQFSRLKGASQR